MVINRSEGIGWYHTAGVLALPWVWHFQPAWAAIVVVLVLIGHRSAVRSREGEPWRSVAVVVSAFAALLYAGGWAVAGGWFVVALAVGAGVAVFPKNQGWARPDVIDVAAGAAVAGALAMRPELFLPTHGGWVAPVIMIVGTRRLVTYLQQTWNTPGPFEALRPPTRDVRGTVTFSGVVAGVDGLPRTIPQDLEIRAGVSLAILCDDGSAAWDLAETLAGRRRPVEGQFCIDGTPPEKGEALVSVVGLSEPFLVGDLHQNVAALCGGSLDPDQRAAVRDACALSEIEEALSGSPIREDGLPLDPHHRVMVQLARVLVSHYRILVVVDPMVSVNPVRSELWKAAVVRSSVGRTSIWITPDRELCGRADQMMILRHGTLKPVGVEVSHQ